MTKQQLVDELESIRGKIWVCWQREEHAANIVELNKALYDINYLLDHVKLNLKVTNE